MDLQRWLREAVRHVAAWQDEFGPYEPHAFGYDEHLGHLTTRSLQT